MIDEPLALLAEAFGQDPERETRPASTTVPATELISPDMGTATFTAVFTSGLADAAKLDAQHA